MTDKLLNNAFIRDNNLEPVIERMQDSNVVVGIDYDYLESVFLGPDKIIYYNLDLDINNLELNIKKHRGKPLERMIIFVEASITIGLTKIDSILNLIKGRLKMDGEINYGFRLDKEIPSDKLRVIILAR